MTPTLDTLTRSRMIAEKIVRDNPSVLDTRIRAKFAQDSEGAWHWIGPNIFSTDPNDREARNAAMDLAIDYARNSEYGVDIHLGQFAPGCWITTRATAKVGGIKDTLAAAIAEALWEALELGEEE